MMADAFKPCAVDGCNGNAHHSARGSREYCLKHYRKWQKYGDATAGREYSPGEKCSVYDCDAPAKSRGWCPLHYKRWKRNGDPEKRIRRDNAPGQECSVPWCTQGSKKMGLCETHYAYRRANPDRPASEIKPRVSRESWIIEHVGWSSENCLIWPFYRKNNGYGQVTWGERRMIASRAMCIAAHGEPPTPQHEAAHSCGRGHEGCVHPKHLYWATRSENQMDRVAHGTSNRGERHGMAKLTSIDVLGIRAMLPVMSYAKIGRQFGVSRANVGSIARGKIWSWLD